MYIKCGLLKRLRWGLQILVKVSVPNDHLEYYNDLLKEKNVQIDPRLAFFLLSFRSKRFSSYKLKYFLNVLGHFHVLSFLKYTGTAYLFNLSQIPLHAPMILG